MDCSTAKCYSGDRDLYPCPQVSYNQLRHLFTPWLYLDTVKIYIYFHWSFIYIGRNFPKRHGFQLLAEARFDGELLSSDLVPHVEHPEFTQELAWELNKKSLQQHRLQRSSIKVQVYAVNAQSTAKEAVGYIVLDLRSATTQQVSPLREIYVLIFIL